MWAVVREACREQETTWRPPVRQGEMAGKWTAFKSVTPVTETPSIFFFNKEIKLQGKEKSHVLNLIGNLWAGLFEKGVTVIKIIIRPLVLQGIHHFPLISRPKGNGFKWCWLTGLAQQKSGRSRHLSLWELQEKPNESKEKENASNCLPEVITLNVKTRGGERLYPKRCSFSNVSSRTLNQLRLITRYAPALWTFCGEVSHSPS